MNDPNSPAVLVSVVCDLEAAAIVSALASHDIAASTVGGFTAGFRAESPGEIKIVVRQTDLEKAKLALTQIEQEREEIDWSKVDVGEPDEADK
jgi:hypothetical protein